MSTPWPPLPLAEWQDTKDTLQLWTQIVGKVRLALAPMVNHWWQVPLYVNARGLTTSAMPYRGGAVELRFDFLSHALRVETSDGQVRDVFLQPRSVASFYHDLMAVLEAAGVDVRIWRHPVELPGTPVPFDQDEVHGSYDTDAAERFWRAPGGGRPGAPSVPRPVPGQVQPGALLVGGLRPLLHPLLGAAGAPASGGRAQPGRLGHPRGVLARVHQRGLVAGRWPGGRAGVLCVRVSRAGGMSRGADRAGGGELPMEMREWVLPYEAVRTAADPDETLLEFLQSTYGAAADLGGWDRKGLER